MSTKLLIVGGVAGGATAAARARRLSESADIILFERGKDISFASCGLPYHIGGEIKKRDSLLIQTKDAMKKRFDIDVRTETEVIKIDSKARVVYARDLSSGREYVEKYDYLILAPGAKSFLPNLPWVKHPRVFTLRNLTDMDRLNEVLGNGVSNALVVGAGYIGLEIAENLRRRGLEVSLVELLPQVMPSLDPEMAVLVQQQLVSHGIKLFLADSIVSCSDNAQGLSLVLKSGKTLSPQIVIMAVGVRPESDLAQQSGLEISELGAIIVDEHMRTSDPFIYAVGDAIQVKNPVSGAPSYIPLAGPANRQARIAADNIFGRPAQYRGTLGTSILRVFDLAVASVGATEKHLLKIGRSFKKVYIHRHNHATYFPGSSLISIKLLFTPESGKLLGAQIIGGDGIDKRVDILATAIHGGMTVYDLEGLELAYSPQYGSAKDPLNILGNVAVNALTGQEYFAYADEFGPDNRANWTIVDVREPQEYSAGHIPGAISLPLGTLRERWQEIPTDKPIAVYCSVGQRSYYATRILRSHGLKPVNLAGGFTTWKAYSMLFSENIAA